MKCFIYARVSKDEESSTGQLQNEENQLLPLRKFADAMSWEVVEEFIDRISGGNSDRPGFQRMMSRIRQRHADIILVWRLDRFSREGIVNILSYIKQLRTYKTGLKSLQEPWLDTTQEGVADMILGILAWAAAEERRKISDNTKAGLARRKALGIKLGRHPKDCQCPKHQKKTPPLVTIEAEHGQE